MTQPMPSPCISGQNNTIPASQPEELKLSLLGFVFPFLVVPILLKSFLLVPVSCYCWFKCHFLVSSSLAFLGFDFFPMFSKFLLAQVPG